MKKTVFADCRFVLALLFGSLVSGASIAQTTKSIPPASENNDVNVRIIERTGDEVREIERTYQMDGMSNAERDKQVLKLVDSLKATRKNGRRRQMTIIIEDNDGGRTANRERINKNRRREPSITFSPRTAPGAPQAWSYEFRKDFDSLADQMKHFKFQFPRDFDRQIARPFEDWSRNFGGKPSTIRGLDAYPNNPDHGQLNVRFTAPAKGDISIIVTNPKGKEIAKQEIKDFSGEFVGQIDLGKKTQGTYFITVTQNEDGAVKRIVID